MELCETWYGLARVFLVIDAVPIRIGDWAAIVACYSGDGPTAVMFVIYAITVCIGYRTTLVTFESGNKRTLVYVIINAVLICIGFFLYGIPKCTPTCRSACLESCTNADRTLPDPIKNGPTRNATPALKWVNWL